jgi:DNA-binding beta-propeller fold protein YncE
MYAIAGGGPDTVVVINSENNTVVKNISLSTSCYFCAPNFVNSIAFNPKNGDMYAIGATVHFNQTGGVDGNCLSKCSHCNHMLESSAQPCIRITGSD